MFGAGFACFVALPERPHGKQVRRLYALNMTETSGGHKRSVHWMTRGSFRFMLSTWAGLTIISVLLTLNALVWRSPWDPPSLFLALGLFLISAVSLGYLLRARKNDAPFWDEDESRRADWDRRGRQL